MSSFSRGFNFDGSSKPTWDFVVLLVLMLAFEMIGEFAIDFFKAKPKMDYGGCISVCNSYVLEITRDSCKCHYFKEDPDE